MTAHGSTKYEWQFNAKTTLGEVEKILLRHRLRVHSMTSKEDDWTVKLQGHSKFYYGHGSTMAAALVSALDDFGMDMIATYARAN